MGRNELVAAAEQDIPAIDAVEPRWAPYVVMILRETGQAAAALKYAYRSLRRYYSFQEVHRAYLDLLAPGSGLGIAPSQPEAVDAGTAVCFIEDGTQESVWIVIEDDAECHAALGERRPDHPLVRHLLGKRVGETVVLADSGIAKRSARITEIVDKHVYRYRDVINGWQLRFPEKPGVQMVRLPSKDGPEGQVDLDPIMKMVDARASRASDILQLYKEKAIPVHLVASALHRSVLALSLGLAEASDFDVRVGSRAPEEVQITFSSLRAGHELVMDSSAIATMLLLDGERIFGLTKPQVLVPCSVNDDCGRAASEVVKSPGAGSLFQVPGGHVFHVTTAEESAASRRLEKQLAEFRTYVRLVGCPTFAALPPERRKELARIFGLCGAEAIASASVPGRVLWTDDFVQACIARQWFGVPSLSTELVLRSLAGRGAIEAKLYQLACAKLIGWRYVPTPVDTNILVEAARASEWNPGRFPLSAVIGLFGQDAFPSPGVGQIVCHGVPMLFDEIALPETRATLLVGFLDQIAKRADWHPIVMGIGRNLPAAFGLNVLRCREAQRSVATWLALREASA